MKKFGRKILLHSLLLSVVVVAIIMVRYVNQTHRLLPDLGSLPTNFVSNSVCFNAKLDHARQDGRLLSAKTLIIGSSMGLNNVSGAILTQATGSRAYNFSSWGFKPHETYQVLKQLDGKLHITRLIIPFNNTEFLADAKQIDYERVYDHFFAKHLLQRIPTYFANFTLDDFVKDWSFRTKYIYRTNEGYTLNFANDGSIQLHPRHFVRAKDDRALAYHDTTGFGKFRQSIHGINRYCEQRHIALTLVYLPWRQSLLTPNRLKQVQGVSDYLSATYGRKFVDLSRLPVDNKHFVDAGHMFAGGAEVVTNALVDSLTTRRRMLTPPKPVLTNQRTAVASL